jgi:hypothetical protein
MCKLQTAGGWHWHLSINSTACGYHPPFMTSPTHTPAGKEAERIAVSSRRAATSPVQPRPRPEVVAAEGAAPEPAAALASVGGGQGEGEGDQAPVLRPGYTPDLKYMAHLW